MGDPRKIEELGRMLAEVRKTRQVMQKALLHPDAWASKGVRASISLTLIRATRDEVQILEALRKEHGVSGAQVGRRQVQVTAPKVLGGPPLPPLTTPLIRSTMGVPTELPAPPEYPGAASRIMPGPITPAEYMARLEEEGAAAMARMRARIVGPRAPVAIPRRFEATPEVIAQVEAVMAAREEGLIAQGIDPIRARLESVEAGRQQLVALGMPLGEANARARDLVRALMPIAPYPGAGRDWGIVAEMERIRSLAGIRAELPIGEAYADALARALPGRAGAGVMGETVFGLVGGSARVLGGLPAASRPLNEVVEAINAGRWEKSGGKLYIW